MARCRDCGRFLSSKPYPNSRKLPGSRLERHMEAAHGWKKNTHRETEYGIEL